MSEQKKIQIPKPVMVDPKKLKLNPKNIKRHDEKQLHDLGVLYEMIGFTDPIIADKKNVVWAGNGSLQEALEKNMSEVPVIYIPDEWTKDQKKMFMLMDNKITESPWEFANFKPMFDAVSPQLGEIFQADFSALVDLANSKLKIVAPVEGEILEPPAEPKSKLGNIYQLDNHRIMCGDSTNKQHLSVLLQDKKIDQLLTDPPYGVDYSNKNKFLNTIGKGNRIETPITNDADIDFRDFFGKFLEIIPFSEYNTIYVFLAGKHSLSLVLAFNDKKINWSTWLIWKKNNHVLGRMDYATIHEPFIYGWKGKHKFYGGFHTSVFEYDKPLVSDLHPTMKPVDLLADIIQTGSRDNMLVYDPFLGSGSTLIACELTKRICYGMEIEPSYCDVIVKRWEDYTGKKAKLL